MSVVPHSIGVEIGPVKTRLARVDDNGTILEHDTIATGADLGVDSVVQNVIAAAREMIEREPIVALGVALVSPLALDEESAPFAPNLRWRNVPIQGKIGDVLDVSVRVTSDVRAATWAEFTHGPGQNARHVVGLFVGAGVGGAAIHDGRFIDGHVSAGGEFGHMTVVSGGRECHCPNTGCLEAYVGGWAIAERARKAVRDNMDDGALLVQTAGSISSITADHLAQTFAQGDPLSMTLVDETAHYLGDGVTTIVNLFNPKFVMIGGSITQRLPVLVEKVRERVRKCALGLAVHDLQIVHTQLGRDAAVIGAAAWARAR